MGMIIPDDEAMRPKVTIPLLNAWPDDPRIANAVMLVPNSDSRNTTGPSDRLARKYSSAPWATPRFRNANTPMYSTTPRYATTMRAGIIRDAGGAAPHPPNPPLAHGSGSRSLAAVARPRLLDGRARHNAPGWPAGRLRQRRNTRGKRGRSAGSRRRAAAPSARTRCPGAGRTR